MPTITAAGLKDRTQLRLTGEGLIAESMPRTVPNSTLTLTGGTAYGVLLGVRAGDVVSNVVVQCTTAGSGTTLFKAGVYSKDGVTRYAVSADTSSSFGTTGMKSVAVSWTCPADDAYMVVFVSTASTTLPTLARSAGAVLGAVGSGALPFCTAGTGLSDLPAAGATFAIANAFGFWVGLA